MFSKVSKTRVYGPFQNMNNLKKIIHFKKLIKHSFMEFKYHVAEIVLEMMVQCCNLFSATKKCLWFFMKLRYLKISLSLELQLALKN